MKFAGAVAIALVGLLATVHSLAAGNLAAYRDQIQQAYNARDSQALEAIVASLARAGTNSGEADLATYYAAFARLRQSAIPGITKDRARDYLGQCITELEPLVGRRTDYAQARALYASCLGASANYYVMRAATRGIAARREMSAAVKLAPDNPWVVFQGAVSDFLTPAMFGGNTERALVGLRRAEQLFVASRPTGSSGPVFGESETWLYIGRVLVSLDRKDEGRKALDKALDLAPDNADVRDELAKL
ncbi:MAG: tetratricopeptide repeat protein [Gammaproteobacteria bacterium]